MRRLMLGLLYITGHAATITITISSGGAISQNFLCGTANCDTISQPGYSTTQTFNLAPGGMATVTQPLLLTYTALANLQAPEEAVFIQSVGASDGVSYAIPITNFFGGVGEAFDARPTVGASSTKTLTIGQGGPAADANLSFCDGIGGVNVHPIISVPTQTVPLGQSVTFPITYSLTYNGGSNGILPTNPGCSSSPGAGPGPVPGPGSSVPEPGSFLLVGLGLLTPVLRSIKCAL